MLKKRVIALLLTLVMVLGLVPVGAVTTGNDITVYVSISVKGEFQLAKDGITGMVQVPVEVPRGSTAADALVETHKLYHQMGSDSYREENGQFTEFWGETTSNIGYFVNGAMVMDTTAALAEGDYVEGTIYENWQTDYYTAFNVCTLSVQTDETFLITASYLTINDAINEKNTFAAFSGANILMDDGTACGIPWDDSKGIVTDQDGAAFLSFSEAGTYYISAAKDGYGMVPAVCVVTVTENTDDKAAIVKADQEALTFDNIKGQNGTSDAVTTNLTLPKLGKSGKTSITWASSNTNVIKNDGTVVRPVSTAGDAQVTLTATIAYGNETQTKEFLLTVTKLPSSEEVLSAVVAGLPTSLRPKEWNSTKTEKQDTNVISMVQALVTAKNPAVKVEATCVPGEQTQVAADGTITYGDKAVSYKNVTFTLSLGNASILYTTQVSIPAKAPTKQEAFEAVWLTFDTIKGENSVANDVKANLTLPSEDSKGYYTEIKWTSSDSGVISIDTYPTNSSYKATVTRPKAGEAAAEVTLTAKIKPGSYWQYGMAPAGPMPDPAYGTKSFTLTVPPLTQEEQTAAEQMLKDAIKLYSLDEVTVRGTKNKANLMALTYSINDIPFNWNYVNRLEGFKEEYRNIKVEWSTTNPGFKDGKIDSGAAVVRASGDQTGKIILTLSYSGLVETKEWDTKILAFSKADAKAENDRLAEIKDNVTFDLIKKDNVSADEVTTMLALYEGAKIVNGEITFCKKSEAYHVPGAHILWTSSNTKVISVEWNGLKVTRPAKTTQVTLTATLTSPMFGTAPGVNTYTKNIVVTVPAKNESEQDILLRKIAGRYKDDIATFWQAVGMKSYADYMGVSNPVTADAKQSFVNAQIDAVVSATGKTGIDANKLASAINGLSALGYDPTQLETVNHTKINAVERLKGLLGTTIPTGWYSTVAPYVLAALNQGNYDTEAQETAHVTYLLEELKNVSWSWGVDTPCMILQGLIPYYNRGEVKTAVDAAINVLAEKQGSTGSFGNANGDAMAMIALSMLGINPDADSRFVKGDKSLLDGLLSYQTADKNGFGYTNTTYNEMATYQGFVALSSAFQVMNTGKAYNPYDCSAFPKVPAKASGNTTPSVPSKPSGNQNITVYVAVKTPQETWISQTSTTVKSDATVYHAFTQVLDTKGFRYVGAESNYVSSITHSNGTTLAEFDMGKHSGWLYKVNGKLPDVGICDKTLSNGDSIVFYYTKDWTKDPDAGSVGGSGSSNTGTVGKPSVDASGNVSVSVETAAKTDANGTAAATVDKKEVEQAVQKMTQAAGNSDGKKKVTLEIKASKDAQKVETTLPSGLLGSVNEKVDAMTLKTPLAELSLDSETLKGITKEVGGGAVRLSVERADTKTMSKENQKLIGDHPVFAFQITSGRNSIRKFDGKITVRLPYTPGANEDTKKLTAYYVAENGEVKEMVGAKYDAESKAIVFETDHFSIFAVVYDENKASFADVSETAWYAEAISFVVSRNLFHGVSETAFAPNEKMTRAMLFTVLHRMSGDNSFTGGEHWYENGMNWAKEKGISDGTNPEGNVSREMIATMLWRYAGSPSLTDYKGLQGFSDAASISDWASTAIAWAHEKGIVQGTTQTTLNPKGAATRAEVAAMMMRFLKSH